MNPSIFTSLQKYKARPNLSGTVETTLITLYPTSFTKVIYLIALQFLPPLSPERFFIPFPQ
jgi:hypothetical protein